MVVRFGAKIKKRRGKRWHGFGSKKKHRGKGSRGGKGFAGSAKHRWSYITTYKPDHFSGKGFFSLKKKYKEINIDQLVKLTGNKKDIDLSTHGYSKLLGRGEISKAINVKVESFTTSAKEKIEAAGGTVSQ